MAPDEEAIVSYYSHPRLSLSRQPRLSSDGLKRTVSDMSLESSKQGSDTIALEIVSEVRDAKCECCGMIEECSPEYIQKIRDKFSGKLICGLCSEAVNEEMGKNGGDMDKALNALMTTCFRFSKFDRAYPVLRQAEAMREIFKKTTAKAKSLTAMDRFSGKKTGIARSSSCLAAITTREIE